MNRCMKDLCQYCGAKMRTVAGGNLRSTLWCARCGSLAVRDVVRGLEVHENPSAPEIHRVLKWQQDVQRCRGLLAYVIGPYRAATREDIRGNVRRAAAAAALVLAAGYTPVCPHTMTDPIAAIDGAPDFCDPRWLNHTLRLLERCDLAVRMPGWQESEGSREEVRHARTIGVPIRDIHEVATREAPDAGD